MTLEEYEKVLEEKRKALQATKIEERKVDTKAFETMQQLSSKKSNNDEIFIKLVRYLNSSLFHFGVGKLLFIIEFVLIGRLNGGVIREQTRTSAQLRRKRRPRRSRLFTNCSLRRI